MKRIIMVISVLLVFGIAAATFAYQRSNTVAASDCCCSGDSCPMKKKDGSTADKVSCSKDFKDDCCKGDSCPMKKGTASHDHESCPMMKDKDHASHASMTAEEHQAMMADGKSYCDCCDAKKDA